MAGWPWSAPFVCLIVTFAGQRRSKGGRNPTHGARPLHRVVFFFDHGSCMNDILVIMNAAAINRRQQEHKGHHQSKRQSEHASCSIWGKSIRSFFGGKQLESSSDLE